jgi:hypothetical protein
MPINVISVDYDDFVRNEVPIMIIKHNPEVATKIINMEYQEQEFNFVYAKENYVNSPFVT